MLKNNDILKYLQENNIIEKIGHGATVNALKDGKLNFMAISWGLVGVLWNKPIINVYVRECRNTFNAIKDEFTVSLSDETNKEVMKVAGTMSGRDVNKQELLNLELVDSKVIKTPGYTLMPYTLECKILHRQELDWNQIPADAKEMFHSDSNAAGLRENGLRDYHTVYTAEIVNCYTIKK